MDNKYLKNIFFCVIFGLVFSSIIISILELDKIYLIPLLIVISYIPYPYLKTRSLCPNCKSAYSMQMIKEQIINKENITQDFHHNERTFEITHKEQSYKCKTCGYVKVVLTKNKT